MKKNVLIIGAGGVAQVVAHKCAQNNVVLGEISIASRTLAKCEAIAASVEEKKSWQQPAKLHCYQLDALDVAATAELIRAINAQIVINVGSAFLNMSVLSACIETGAAYLDTAIHEDPAKICETPPWYGNYEWKRLQECADNKVTAILGVGFDPGVVNAYAALAANHYFDTIDSIDIIDINGGDHGRYLPPTSTRKSTSANLPVVSGPGKTASGNKTRCSRSSVPMTCPWSASAPAT